MGCFFPTGNAILYAVGRRSVSRTTRLEPPGKGPAAAALIAAPNAIARANSSPFSKSSTLPYPPATAIELMLDNHSAHLFQGDERLARQAARTAASLSCPRPSTVPGSISSRGSSPARTFRAAPHPGRDQAGTQTPHLGRHRQHQPIPRRSTPGPIGSMRQPGRSSILKSDAPSSADPPGIVDMDVADRLRTGAVAPNRH